MPGLPSLRSKAPEQDVTDVLRVFESETAEVIARTNPYLEQSMVRVFSAVIVFALLFMGFFEIDRVVTSLNGQTVSANGLLVVQPLNEGIIKSINVRVGAEVKKGQVLATLDSTFTSADLTQLQDKADSTRAEMERLQAQHDDKPFVPSRSGHYYTLQYGLWTQLQAQYHSNLNDYNEKISGLSAQITQLKAEILFYRTRLGYAKDIEKMRVDLMNNGSGSQLNAIIASDARVEMERTLNNDENNLPITEHSLLSIQAERDVYIQQWHSNIDQTLFTDKTTLSSTEQDIAKAAALQGLVDLVSPEDALVLSVANVSVGSVLMAGQQLFTLMPVKAPLEMDLQIATSDIGFITTGQRVNVKLDAYEYLRHGICKGIIRSISENSFTQNPDGTPAQAPYYDVRVKIVETALHDVPADFRLIPGMTGAGDILVGHRTILSYMLESSLRTTFEAMREP